MKKVLGKMSGIIFAAFGVAVLGLLMSLTYGALQKLFPNSFSNQMWGLVMFDIAAMCWALAFVFKSETVGQYATAAIGFVVAFLGTLGMVAAEVVLSGQQYVETSSNVGRWLVYGFIIVTAIHAALLYAYHAAAPDINEKINVGIARGEIVSEAIRQATQSLDVQKSLLAESIHREIVDQVKRDLGIATRGQVLDLPALDADPPPHPLVIPNAYGGVNTKKRQTKNAGWFMNLRRKFARNSEPAAVYEQAIPQPQEPHTVDWHVEQIEKEAQQPRQDYGPEWENSTDITPTLDAYAWVCLHCDGHNPPHARKCRWCQQPRINKSPVTAFADLPPTPQAKPANQPLPDGYIPTYLAQEDKPADATRGAPFPGTE